MKLINISLNPTYLCNLRCHFCYLSEAQLSDKHLLPIGRLGEMLESLSMKRELASIDLYGGEPSLLPKKYLLELEALLMMYVPSVSVITNGTRINDAFFSDFFKLYVSYDHTVREESEKTLENIETYIKHGKMVDVLTLATPELMEYDPEVYVETLKRLGVYSIELKPYSTNQNNQLPATNKDFEQYTIRLIEACRKYDLLCMNEIKIKWIVRGDGHAYSDEHIYITPNGYAVLDFDLNDNEYFKEVKDLEEYEAWAADEYVKVNSNPYCKDCRYLGRCLSEHLRPVINMDNSCSGFFNLLEHYRESK